MDGLLDVHAAACGVILEPPLRHPIAQGGLRGGVPHRGHCPVDSGGLGVLPGAPSLPSAVPSLPRGAEGMHAAGWWRGSCWGATRRGRNLLHAGVCGRALGAAP